MAPTDEALTDIFQRLKALLAPYEHEMVPRTATERHYDLWTTKDVVIEGRKRKGVYFAGLIIQKGYVGLYYMPVYAEPEMQVLFSERLLKLLKGKSCFHIRELDEELEGQIAKALGEGYTLYQQRGWV